MIPPLLAEHDTWISVDPLVGCPANCSYCYLGKLDLRSKRPRQRVDPSFAAMQLRSYILGRRAQLIDPELDRTPICIGNYTDMLLTRKNRDFLLALVGNIAASISERPLVLITKGTVTDSLVSELDGFGWPIIWFFSQSFSSRFPGIERGPVADFETTLANAAIVAASDHQAAVHFWRPFVPVLSSGLDKTHVIQRLKVSGMKCSVVIGLRVGDGVPVDDERLKLLVPEFVPSSPVRSSEIIDSDGWEEVRKVAASNSYSVYRHSSCAIALALQSAEQLGTWRTDVKMDHCRPCHCPPLQRSICEDRFEDGDRSELALSRFCARVAKFLGLNEDAIAHDAKQGTFTVKAAISEYEFNAMLHAAKGLYRPIAEVVLGKKAWQGPFL